MTNHKTETIIDANTGIVSTVTSDFTTENLFKRVKSIFLQILHTSDLFDEFDFLKQDVLPVRLFNNLVKAIGYETATEFNNTASVYTRADVATLLARACFRELFAIFSETDNKAKLSDIKFILNSTEDTRTNVEKLNYFFGYLND